MSVRRGRVQHVGVAVAASLAACQTPLEPDTTAELRASVEAAIRQRFEALPAAGMRPVTRPPGVLDEELAKRRDELNRMGPSTDIAPGSLELGPDLLGEPQREVAVSLQTSVATAVNNNLFAQQARLEPAIREADVVAAEAVFDALLFADASFVRSDVPTVVPVIQGFPLGTGENIGKTWNFDTGLRKQLETGGEVVVSTTAQRSSNQSPGLTLLPDPAWTSSVNLGLAQPLLRGFGSDVNNARVDIARNAERSSVQELRRTLLDLVLEIETGYWDLVVAREELRIRLWLVEVGEQVRQVLERRREFDTRQSQYSDAVATVEQRKAQVVRTQFAVRQASDRLKALINDPQLPLENEILLVPSDFMVEAPVNIDLREATLTAVQYRPEVTQALLAIDDASVRVVVADNNRLPTLDLTAQVTFWGLDDSVSGAYSEIGEGSFVDYFVGANFSQPIGNRAAEAGFRAARLQRSSSIIAFRQTVQDVTLQVKEALRACQTEYDLIGRTRSTRLAEAENLRTLLVEEQTLASLTPEFLNLKFQRQDRLAIAQFEEFRALARYNIAVASLYRALGTGLEMNRIELDVDRLTAARP